MGVDDFKFRFNPSSAGGGRVLGPLEGDIMEVIWRRGPSTVSQVHKELLTSKEIAYTTVMTTMSRLARKRLLDQDRSLPSYLYSARLDRASFESYVVRGIMEALISDYRAIFADCLIGSLSLLSDSDREKLKRALS
jgi:predicted transcriptional regulator